MLGLILWKQKWMRTAAGTAGLAGAGHAGLSHNASHRALADQRYSYGADQKFSPTAMLLTGGGIPSKFGRVLKRSGLGARLDRLFAPQDFVQKLVELGGVDFETAYRQWNMGNAMLLVVLGMVTYIPAISLWLPGVLGMQ